VFTRDGPELANAGLYVELSPWGFHVGGLAWSVSVRGPDTNRGSVVRSPFSVFAARNSTAAETSITELQGSNAFLPFTRLLEVRLSSSDRPAGTMLGWS
jgi:hypothetical protein